jgi:hypothetical protein
MGGPESPIPIPYLLLLPHFPLVLRDSQAASGMNNARMQIIRAEKSFIHGVDARTSQGEAEKRRTQSCTLFPTPDRQKRMK